MQNNKKMRRKWSSLFRRVVHRLGFADGQEVAVPGPGKTGATLSSRANQHKTAQKENEREPRCEAENAIEEQECDASAHSDTILSDATPSTSSSKEAAVAPPKVVDENQHKQKQNQHQNDYSAAGTHDYEDMDSQSGGNQLQDRSPIDATMDPRSAMFAQERRNEQLLRKFQSKGTLESKYEVLDDILGSGQFAVVKACRERRTGRLRAVKFVERKRTSAERLLLEIDILLRVKGHPNIVGLFDVFLTEDEVQLVMEYVPGGELFEHLVSNGPYSEAEAARHMRRIASAVEHLHRHNIVHRDLKPENLLLTSHNPVYADVKVADFGLARMYTESAMQTICGTWAYAAPEVRNDPVGYGPKVDVWSMGVILYVLLVAFHPFDPRGNLSEDELWHRIENGMFDFREKAWKNISEEAKDLIDRMLVIDPKKRLSAAEVLAHPWLCDCEQPLFPLSPNINTDLAALRARYARRKFAGTSKAVWAHAAFLNIQTNSKPKQDQTAICNEEKEQPTADHDVLLALSARAHTT